MSAGIETFNHSVNSFILYLPQLCIKAREKDLDD